MHNFQYGTGMNLFDNIKETRKNKGITLKEMSRRSGVSVNYLSQIERGASNPSIGIIKKICDVLEIPFSALGHRTSNDYTNEAVGSGPKIGVVRKNMRRTILPPQSKVRQFLLTPDCQRKLTVLLTEMAPGEEHDEAWHRYEGEGFALVLEGSYEATVDDKVFILEEGDSICFPSNIPHKFKAVSNQTARAIWVMTPPLF